MGNTDDDDDDNNQSRMALHRAFYRLEGRFGPLESRVVNLEATTDRRLSTMATKLEQIADILSTMALEDATDKGKVKGGWFVIVTIGTLSVTVVGLVITLLQYAGK